LGLSGIIALFTCAIIFSMYGFQNLSTEAKHGTILAFETVRYVAQAFIFAYLGASLLTIQTHAAAIGLALLLILSIPLVRFLSIAMLPLIYRIGQRTFPLGSGERKMLWYCGLMRGVIAFALSLQIESENKSFMVTLSLLVVMSTTISGATLLRTFASRIGLTEIGIIRFGEVKE
jgi:sodium/hydrogen exchanger-like protein 6/7